MKKGIHPNWTAQAQVTCSCGNVFTVGSTSEKLQVDICSKCHPFFTGEMKFVDRQGRVQKFQAKIDAANQNKAVKSKAKKNEDKAPVQSYQDILRNQQTVLKSEEKAKKAAIKA